MTESQIASMDLINYVRGIHYSWLTFNSRRVDLLARALGGEGKDKDTPMKWQHPLIEEYIKQENQNVSIIPPYHPPLKKRGRT